MLKLRSWILKSAMLAIFCVVLLMSFTGCQSSSGTNSSQSAAPASGSQPAVSEQPAAQTEGEILIGVDAALTGPSPLPGVRTKQGINLAVEEINKSGGVLGKNLKVIYEDDQATPNGAVNAVNKLISQDIVAMIGPHFSGNVMAVQAVMEKYQKPFLVGGTSPALLTANNPWLFRIRASDTFVSKITAKFAVEELKAKKVGMLYDNDAYGTGARDVATEYLKSINIPLFCEGFNTGDKDMTGQLIKMKNNGIECLIIWSHDAESAIAAKQAKQLNLNIPIIGNPGFVSDIVLNLMDASTSDGIYTITDFTPTNPDERVQKFVSAFKEKYSVTPELYAAGYYDATCVLADSIERAGSTDPEKIRQALLATKDFKGVMSTLSSNEKGEMVHEAIIAQIKDKNVQMIKVIRE